MSWRRSATSNPNRQAAGAGEAAAWGVGLLAGAAVAALSLRVLGASTAGWILVSWALGAFALPLLGPRDPGPRLCALAAGAVAGWVVGVALALPTPAGWFFPDIAWHTAKAATAAAGQLLDDPILRIPTLYPFLFGAVVGAPVALGAAPAAAMWASAPLSLGAACFAHHRLARTFLAPLPAAWVAAALPAFFYFPTRAYILLPTPFNLSLAFVFGGLALGARYLDGGDARRGMAAGLGLGVAGLLWYAHLPWLLAWVLWIVARRGREVWPLLAGAVPCAAVLGLHLVLLAGRGLLGGSAVAAPAVLGDWPHWLAIAGRNALTLSGAAPLAEVPAWIGPFLVGLLAVAWLRRDGQRPWLHPAAGVGAAALVGVALVVGQRLTYGESFLWRYAFLCFGLLLPAAGRARPWRLAGRRVPPLAAAALVAALAVPGWLLAGYETSVIYAERYEIAGRDLQQFLEEHTAFDEPVFAPIPVWEATIGCCVPRPNLVDRQGGQYKYTSARAVGERWRDYLEIRNETDARAIAARLRPYGFRYAVLRVENRSPGFAALAAGFDVVFRNRRYLVVDLERPAAGGAGAGSEPRPAPWERRP